MAEYFKFFKFVEYPVFQFSLSLSCSLRYFEEAQRFQAQEMLLLILLSESIGFQVTGILWNFIRHCTVTPVTSYSDPGIERISNWTIPSGYMEVA